MPQFVAQLSRGAVFFRGILESGIRENGAQYTHAAAWVAQAAALLGRGDLAVKLFGYLNPINHALCKDDVARYKTEPYVLAGDVFSKPPHEGRGGWSWYTGSAGWMYRIGLETILGFHRRGDRLRIEPRVPEGWERFRIDYRYGSTTYEIEVVRSDHHGQEAAEAGLGRGDVEHDRGDAARRHTTDAAHGRHRRQNR